MPAVSSRYSLRTLLLAVTTFGIACALMTRAAFFPPGVPIAIAIPIFWCGVAFLAADSANRDNYHVLGFLGCCLLGLAVLIAVIGTPLVTLMWVIEPGGDPPV